MKKILAGMSLVTALSGCVVNPPAAPQQIILNSTFETEQAKQDIQPGTASIEGNAFMRQNGGGVVTCAGSEVILIPWNEYSLERMKHLYGASPLEGRTYLRGIYAAPVQFMPESANYQAITLKTICDSQGKFEFKNVKAGSFFIVTTVRWAVGNMPNGGTLATKVVTQDERTSKVIMAH